MNIIPADTSVDLQKIDSHFNTATVGSCQEFMNCKWENAIPDAFIISALFMNEKRVFPILGRIQSIVLPETNRVEQMKPIVFLCAYEIEFEMLCQRQQSFFSPPWGVDESDFINDTELSVTHEEFQV